MPPSQARRLGKLAHRCGSGSISVLIDHEAQLDALATLSDIAGFKIGIFVKIDTGYHRAGLSTTSEEFRTLIAQIVASDAAGTGYLQGLYSHAGHSYHGNSEHHAMSLLKEELCCLERAAQICDDLCSESVDQRLRPLILSVGATPTATSIQNTIGEATQSMDTHKKASELKLCLNRINKEYEVELHAGVYPLLDMQQLATHASPSALTTPTVTVDASRPNSAEMLPTADASPSASLGSISTADVGLTILAEVASVYPGRQNPEALIAAGSLALGREPCKCRLSLLDHLCPL